MVKNFLPEKTRSSLLTDYALSETPPGKGGLYEAVPINDLNPKTPPFEKGGSGGI